MRSFTFKKAVDHQSALVSVGILFHTSAALAGQPAGDAQEQARDLLTGALIQQATLTYKSPSPAVGERWTPNIDPQEQARRLILGTPNAVAGPTVDRTLADASPVNRHTNSNPQELARRMILGDKAAKTPSPRHSASAAQGVDSSH
jgi:hypothetical protein